MIFPARQVESVVYRPKFRPKLSMTQRDETNRREAAKQVERPRVIYSGAAVNEAENAACIGRQTGPWPRDLQAAIAIADRKPSKTDLNAAAPCDHATGSSICMIPCLPLPTRYL